MFELSSGVKINIEKITHVQIAANQTTVYPVDYHSIILVGQEAERLVEAVRAAGFVGGEGFLINPQRVSVIEPAANLNKVWLEGADKILYVSHETAAALENIPAEVRPAIHFPVPETMVGDLRETAPVEKVVKASKKKGAD